MLSNSQNFKTYFLSLPGTYYPYLLFLLSLTFLLIFLCLYSCLPSTKRFPQSKLLVYPFFFSYIQPVVYLNCFVLDFCYCFFFSRPDISASLCELSCFIFFYSSSSILFAYCKFLIHS